MKNVLVVKANNRPDGISTKMYGSFLEEASNNKTLNIKTFDVFEENLPHYGQDLFDALEKLQNNDELTISEKAALEAKEKSQTAIAKADVIVFVFPLWNLTIPSALLDFLNYSIQAGFSFKYTADGNREFMLGDKKVYLLNSRGGYYNTPEMNELEMAVNYMNIVINNFFGLKITDEVIIEGHAQDQKNAETIITDGLNKVKKLAASI